MKITILGYSGSGKSTLAKELADYYQLPLLHLDTVQFLPNWKERPLLEGQKIVTTFMQTNNSWIIDGNYQKYYRKERLEEADEIIILAFSRLACLTRVIRRYLKYRNTTRPDMAQGCPEKIDWSFIWWILYQGRAKHPLSVFLKIKSQYPSKTTIIRNQKQFNNYQKRVKVH